MKRLSIKSTWVVEREYGQRLGPELFAMVNAIHDAGKLTEAVRRLGMSYRHAWNLVEGWNAFFGAPLVRRARHAVPRRRAPRQYCPCRST